MNDRTPLRRFAPLAWFVISAATVLGTSNRAFGADTKAPDERVLGEFLVTGVTTEHVPKIAILPSVSPDYEDVVVRSVVRRDLEISGMFRLIPDQDAPPGLYDFDDPVDVAAWQKKGAEAIVKVAARRVAGDKIEVVGIAYFVSAGPTPVYEVKLTSERSEARATAHHITDELLGALTGRPGGFSSAFTFSMPWGRNRRVASVDADGFGLEPRTDPKTTSIAPALAPDGSLYYSESTNFQPFRLMRLGPETSATPTRVELPFDRSIYSVAFSPDGKKMALAVAEPEGSAIYVGNPDGSNLRRVSVTEVASHPVWSPSGKLAWVGGAAETLGGQRVYVEGKAVSPSGFNASAPTFCNTEDGIFLVYSVSVGGGRYDLVMSGERGGNLSRLTQNQGSNSYPACSSDGRLLAFFSDRNGQKGLYVLSLKRWTTTKVLSTVGESLHWEPKPKLGTKPKPAPEPSGSGTNAAAEERRFTPMRPPCKVSPTLSH